MNVLCSRQSFPVSQLPSYACLSETPSVGSFSHGYGSSERKVGSAVRLVPPPQFTNCSACLAESICGKCKVSQLPSDLAARVKVGDVYKMVCILPAWEIKRLAKNGFRPRPSHWWPCCPFPRLLCGEKSTRAIHNGSNGGKQWRTKVCVSNTRVV